MLYLPGLLLLEVKHGQVVLVAHSRLMDTFLVNIAVCMAIFKRFPETPSDLLPGTP